MYHLRWKTDSCTPWSKSIGMLSFSGKCLFSKMIFSTHSPTNSLQEFHLLHIFNNTWFDQLKKISHSIVGLQWYSILVIIYTFVSLSVSWMLSFDTKGVKTKRWKKNMDPWSWQWVKINQHCNIPDIWISCFLR